MSKGAARRCTKHMGVVADGATPACVCVCVALAVASNCVNRDGKREYVPHDRESAKRYSTPCLSRAKAVGVNHLHWTTNLDPRRSFLAPWL